MTATIISNSMQYTFGMMTNQAISRMIALNTTMARLNEAVATAASGFDGVAGTEYEIGPVPNTFGVQPDPAAPGTKGQDYSYAIGQLATAWQAFWATAAPYIEQLDNGTPGM
jgi:hypothetical protein